MRRLRDAARRKHAASHGLAAALLLAAVAAAPPPSGADLLDPVASRAERMLAEIYDLRDWALRVPYEFALPLIARAKLEGYLEDLPLEDDVRARVSARLGSDAFVDEIVPFLMTLKDVYAGEGADGEDFETHVRSRFAPGDDIPGLEHPLFEWQPEETEAGPSFEIDSELGAALVRFYDALYLRERRTDAPLEKSLACAERTDPEALRATGARAQPSVRELLERVLEKLEAGGEAAHALQAVLDEPIRLETVTLSVVQFIDTFVCKSYRIFATRVQRERQLGAWMQRELEKPGGGELWSYLAYADRERRFGVLVVVDGLQGHLVESLAVGAKDDAFLRRVVGEYDAGANLMRAGSEAEAAPAQETGFLRRVAALGFEHSSYLPFFRGLYARPRGIARVGISTSPTISVRNLPIAKTGAPVAGAGSTGVPNFHFVDRQFNGARAASEASASEIAPRGDAPGRAYYFFGNDALQLGPLTRAAGMRSLFDRLPARSSFSCAAQYDDAAHYAFDAFVNLGVGESQRDFGELRCVAELERRGEHTRELQALRERLLAKRQILTGDLGWFDVFRWLARRDERVVARGLIARIAALEQNALPELLVYYNPWPDHFAHFHGPFSDAVVSPSGELNRLDYWLGRLSAVYRGAGVADRTLFAMAGDHGLAPVFRIASPEVAVFEALRKRGVDFEVLKISSDEGEGPKLTHPLDPPSPRGVDVVVASTAGGNYMLDLFEDQADAWSRQPLYAALTRMKPIARAEDPRFAPIDLVQTLFSGMRSSLDYLVVRETPCDVAGGQVRLVGPRDGKRADAFLTRRGNRVHYGFEGADLLDVGLLTPYEQLTDDQRAIHANLLARCTIESEADLPETWCDETSWRQLTSFTPRPDSVNQLAHLYDSDRAGTINLFPRNGFGYNTIVPGRHAGESFHEKDAFVGLWGAPVRRDGERLRTAVNGSAPTAIWEYLTGELAKQGEDGWGYPSLARQLLRRSR